MKTIYFVQTDSKKQATKDTSYSRQMWTIIISGESGGREFEQVANNTQLRLRQGR